MFFVDFDGDDDPSLFRSACGFAAVAALVIGVMLIAVYVARDMIAAGVR